MDVLLAWAPEEEGRGERGEERRQGRDDEPACEHFCPRRRPSVALSLARSVSPTSCSSRLLAGQPPARAAARCRGRRRPPRLARAHPAFALDRTCRTALSRSLLCSTTWLHRWSHHGPARAPRSSCSAARSDPRTTGDAVRPAPGCRHYQRVRTPHRRATCTSCAAAAPRLDPARAKWEAGEAVMDPERPVSSQSGHAGARKQS